MILSTPAQLDYIPKRIISLVPSQTELLFDLGLDKSVAGITKFCVHPRAWKKNKPIIGGTKNVNLKKIKACYPDLIIANKEENVKEQVEALAEEYAVWITDVPNITAALQMIEDIGLLTHTQIQAIEIISRIKKSFNDIYIPARKIKTYYLIWRNPYMTVGGDTFVHNMLLTCGLENMAADKTRYPEIDISDIKKSGCELLLLSTEPYPFKQKHIHELRELLPGIKIIIVDGEMFSWYGSRLLYSADYFRTIIEELFPY